MHPPNLILADLLDQLDVRSQGLSLADYEQLLRDLATAIAKRREKIYGKRRRIYRQLASTSGN